jgi:ribose transport system ATP-binding protein
VKLIEIARAFYMAPKLLIVDETTTALSRQGRDLLYSLMERLCQEGGSVLFISHDIDEVMEKSDAVTVLKDGNLTATLDKAEF